MIIEKNNSEKQASNKTEDVDKVKAFVQKTKIQNEALKKIILKLKKDKK